MYRENIQIKSRVCIESLCKNLGGSGGLAAIWSWEGGRMAWNSEGREAVHVEMGKRMLGDRMFAGPSLLQDTERTLIHGPGGAPPRLSRLVHIKP